MYGVNLSPNFPYAGELISSMWKKQSGAAPDAVLALDQLYFSCKHNLRISRHTHCQLVRRVLGLNRLRTCGSADRGPVSSRG